MEFSNIKLGSDPEFFLYDKIQDRFQSSEELIGGTKEHPRPIEGREGFFVQEDNILVEGNIPPSGTSDEFAENIDILKKEISLMVPMYSLRIVPSGVFDKEFLNSQQAEELGCMPDFNAYTGKANDTVCLVKGNEGLRSAGGHVHISYYENFLAEEEDTRAIARACDIYLGLPSLLEDKDQERRSLYGSAGAYRDKEYGLEYRSLSNYWTKTKELSKLVFERTIKALEFVTDVGNTHYDERVAKAINSHDLKLTETLILEYGIIN